MRKHLFAPFAAAIMSLALTQVNAQEIEVPQIGSKTPSFTAVTTNGVLQFPEDLGSNWKILLSHPKDFTPVCSSEILELAHSQDEFSKLGAALVVLSTDILEQHRSWIAALEEIDYKDRGTVEIEFPLVDDSNLLISKQYGMLHNQASLSHNIRGVYIIDPDNRIRSVQFYPNEVGRNVEELKRTLIALQTNRADDKVVTPANWQPGQDVIVPVLTQEDKKNIDKPDSPYYQEAWFMTFKRQ